MSFQKTGIYWSKRWSMMFALAALSLALAGCGEGSSSASGGGVEGNTQKMISFEVKNTSGYALKSVQIVSKNGNELAKGDLDCAVGATCPFQGSLNEPGILKFFDGNGSLVGAYILTRKPKNDQYVETSTTMLGLYVFNELRQRYPEPPEALLAKINQSFKNFPSIDGDSDRYAGLGQYYRSSIVGTGLSEDQFYKNLNEILNKGTVLPVKASSTNTVSFFQSVLAAIQRFELVSSAQAAIIEKQECSPQIKQSAELLSKASKYFPPASAMPSLVDAFCLNAQEKTLLKLNQIQAKLDIITTKIDNLGQTVEVLKTFLGNTEAATVWGQMVAENDKLDTTIGLYKTLVGQGTLVDYVQQQGGLENAWKQGNFKDLMTSKIWESLYTNIGSTSNQNRFAGAMNLLCEGTTDSPTTDLIKSRLSCNSSIAKYKSLVLSKNMQFLLILQDMMAAVESRRSQEQAWITGNIPPIGGADVNANWNVQFNTVVKPKLEENMLDVGSNFAAASVAGDAGFFNPIGGLPASLQSRLEDYAFGCSTMNNGVAIPNVSGFVKNGTDSHITLSCDDGNPAVKYKSRYFYTQQGGDTPINLMGVLVPTRSESMGTLLNKTTAMAIGPFTNAWIRVPSNWQTHEDDYDLQSAKQLVVFGTDLQTGKRITQKPNEGGNKVFYTNDAGYPSDRNAHGGLSRLYFRLSDVAGLSYVGAIYAGTADFLEGKAVRTKWGLVFSLVCLSQGPDCKASGTEKDAVIRFTNGPTVMNRMITAGDTLNINLYQ